MRNLLKPQLTTLLQQSYNLLPSEQLDTRHCFSVPNGDSDLRRSKAFLGHCYDKISNGSGRMCYPSRSSAFEGCDSGTDTLSLSFGLNPAHKIIFIK